MRLLVLIIALLTFRAGAETPVTITSIPAGATVSIDQEKIGNAPINNKLFSAGSFTFDVKLSGYAPVSSQIEIFEAKHLEIEFRLNELFPVNFKSKIEGLNFKIGEYSWESQKAKLIMESGRHKVEVYAGSILTDTVVISVSGPLDYIYDPR